METINERIASLIKELNLTKTKFAERIHVSSAFVTMLCKGDSVPSDRTISDICREFFVSEEWLRTGYGEMFVQRTRNQQLALFFNNVLGDADESARKRVISAMADLSVDEWEAILRFAKKMTEGR